MADITEDQQRAAERVVADALAQPTISSLLANTDAAENHDHAYIASYLLNVYNDALRRLTNRDVWGPDDAMRFFKMFALVMEIASPKLKAETFAPKGKPTR
jgi:hypothetical protein